MHLLKGIAFFWLFNYLMIMIIWLFEAIIQSIRGYFSGNIRNLEQLAQHIKQKTGCESTIPISTLHQHLSNPSIREKYQIAITADPARYSNVKMGANKSDASNRKRPSVAWTIDLGDLRSHQVFMVSCFKKIHWIIIYNNWIIILFLLISNNN